MFHHYVKQSIIFLKFQNISAALILKHLETKKSLRMEKFILAMQEERCCYQKRYYRSKTTSAQAATAFQGPHKLQNVHGGSNSVQVRCQTRPCNAAQWSGHGHGQSGKFRHVNVFGLHAVGKRPVESLHQSRDPELHSHDADDESRANASPGAERDQVEMLPLHIHCLEIRLQEPLGAKLQGLIPDARIASHCPHVQEQTCVGRHIVARYGARLECLVR